MSGVEIAFWICAGLVIYAYAGYPLLLSVWARWARRPIRRRGPVPRSASFVLCAHNEEAKIEKRLEELTTLLHNAGVAGEVIVVSDGSTDATAERARDFCKNFPRAGAARSRVRPASGQGGLFDKGLSVGHVRDPHIRRHAPDMGSRRLDPAARAVCRSRRGRGNRRLMLQKTSNVLEGVGTYWRFEKWLRQQEGQIWSVVGATGAISAVRRHLFRPVPPGTILDDVCWPLHVALQGRRVVMEPEAKAFDRLPARATDEFWRKVRTLSGNLQLLTVLPAAFVPWRNPIWLQLVSHKMLRLAVPWLLLALLPLSLYADGRWYHFAFWCQVEAIVLGLLGLWTAASRSRLAAAAGSFLVLNGASWLAFWVWATGRTRRSWHKVKYDRGDSHAATLKSGPSQTQPFVETSAT